VPDGYNRGDPKTWPKGYVKIYDVIGNVVNYVILNNLLKGANTDSTSVTIDLYWNGANGRGMLVAPGVYRVVAYIDYPAPLPGTRDVLTDKRLIQKVGVRK
jgi:hypothetical protein